MLFVQRCRPNFHIRTATEYIAISGRGFTIDHHQELLRAYYQHEYQRPERAVTNLIDQRWPISVVRGLQPWSHL